jgi:superfamily I DNA and/or RNA helicase
LQEFSNESEAELVVSIVQGFLAAGASARDMVVLSPFASQLEVIKGLPEARAEPLLNKAVFGIGNAAEVRIY